MSAEEVVEADKPNSHDDIKVFPNNPESPLSLTLRTSNMNAANPFTPSPKPMTLNPSSHANISGHGIRSGSPVGPHNIPAVSITPRHPHSAGMHHTQISPPSHHQFPTQNFPPHMQSTVVHPGLGPGSLTGIPLHLSSNQGRSN